jgi:glucose-1-phosphate thymidylyltransferase
MRGILLAGGLGTRLFPTTQAVNKHLIPVFDKPMIYYPLTTLMLANVRDIAIVSTNSGVKQFKQLLGDGSQWGISLSYAVQENANGIADGIQKGLKVFEKEDSVLVILGDNIFYGQGLGRHISELVFSDKSMVWIQEVVNPESFGIATLGHDGEIETIVEKPVEDRGNLAITGLYYFPADLKQIVDTVQVSERGEKEITDLLNHYLQSKRLLSEKLLRGVFWLDTGTVDNLLEASLFVRVVQSRLGQLIGSPDEAALRMDFISENQFRDLILNMRESSYKEQLFKLT